MTTINVGSNTPWGEVQSAKILTDGIVFLSTAGHGGFYLSKEKNQTVNKLWRNVNGFYEEDCEWGIVCLTYPGFFSPEDQAAALRTIKNDWPDEYTSIFKQTIPICESSTLRERAFNAANKDNYVVNSAFGDWHEKVPNGYVVGCATIAGRRNNGGNHEKWFLIPEKEYNNRPEFGFIVDPARHDETAPL